MKQKYIDWKPQKRTQPIIYTINLLIDDYFGKQGILLTVRQIYYALIGKGIIGNGDAPYANVQRLCKEGRMAGIIDWNAIEDRSRSFKERYHWDSPEDFLDSVVPQYKRDLWDTQRFYLECWVEKDAQIGIVEQAALKRACSSFSCRGNASVSMLKESAERFKRKVRQGKKVVVLYLGDHDPAGLGMPESIREYWETFGADAELVRLGITKEQAERYNLPSFPAKKSDSRTPKYAKQYGAGCWELDALPPDVVQKLIIDSIDSYLDHEEFNLAQKRQESEQKELLSAIRR